MFSGRVLAANAARQSRRIGLGSNRAKFFVPVQACAFSSHTKRSLLDRIDSGEEFLHGSGYVFEMERRGYLQAGAFVPEVVMKYPEVVEQLHTEFARCGSDVILAFTYYGHRAKLRLIGKDHLLEPMNRNAVKIARKVADQFPGTLVAGNICNTEQYIPGDPAAEKVVREMFTEQVTWAKEEGVDYILGETFAYVGEARIAAEVCRELGMQSVIGLAFFSPKGDGRYGLVDFDGSPGEACKIVHDAGADLVGPNCHQGPESIMDYMRDICLFVDPKRVATWPVAYRTNQGGFSACKDPKHPYPHLLHKGFSFPIALEPFLVTRFEFGEFAKQCQAMGIKYMGGCCGMGPHHMRAMAEALGRITAASEYSADMSKHCGLGESDAGVEILNAAFGGQMEERAGNQPAAFK